MVFNVPNFRVGHAAATHTGKRHAAKRLDSNLDSRDDCSTGGFYTSPTAGQVVTTGVPTVLSWKNTCLNPAPKFIDIYLYSPGTNDSLIQAFDSATYADGSYKIDLDASWWKSTPSISLQFVITEHGTPSFLTTIPTGPFFTATYNSSAVSTSPSKNTASGDTPSIIQRAKNYFGGMSAGSVAAAVIIPILFVAFCIGAYVKWKRGKQNQKTKRFSQAVDKRMSTISTDWRSMSGASANAAIRNSMAIRTSTFGAPSVVGRPSSTFSTAGSGQAGIGTRFGNLETSEEHIPQMSQLRQPRLSAYNASTDRISRVSFAADPRFSVNDLSPPPLPSPTGTGSGSRLQARSFHQGQSFDEQRETPSSEADRELQMSPTQAQGAFALSAADIHARASGDDEDFRKEVLKMPAMTMMRTGHHSQSSSFGDLVISPTASSSSPGYPALPSPILKKSFAPSPTPSSPTGMAPIPTTALSPDAMLRAYAAGRPQPPATPSVLGSGASIASGSNAGGMRILYAPTTESRAGTPAGNSSLGVEERNPFWQSAAARETMYTDSMYSGMAEEDAHDPHGHNTAYGGYGAAQ